MEPLPLAIAGGAISNALIEVLLDKEILTLEEARGILQSAMRSISPHLQSSQDAFKASQIIAGLMKGKFSARDRTP
jgi:hypothetical protein